MSSVTCFWVLGRQGKNVTCDQVNHTQIIIDAFIAIEFFFPVKKMVELNKLPINIMEFLTHAVLLHSWFCNTVGAVTPLQHSRLCTTAKKKVVGFATRLHCVCYVK